MFKTYQKQAACERANRDIYPKQQYLILLDETQARARALHPVRVRRPRAISPRKRS